MATRLVIFDCDGTLVDSQNGIVASMEHAFRAHGRAPPPRPAILSIVGLSLPHAIAVLLPDEPAELVERISQTYKTGYGAVGLDPERRDPLYPGAKGAVASLAVRERIVLGMATGKSRRGVARILEREGWQHHFQTVQTADTSPSKPHPDMIERAMREAGVEPEATLMIGDTTYDIEMARAAGVHAIGVTWGYHEEQALVQAGAHELVRDFGEMLIAIDRRCGFGEEVS